MNEQVKPATGPSWEEYEDNLEQELADVDTRDRIHYSLQDDYNTVHFDNWTGVR